MAPRLRYPARKKTRDVRNQLHVDVRPADWCHVATVASRYTLATAPGPRRLPRVDAGLVSAVPPQREPSRPDELGTRHLESRGHPGLGQITSPRPRSSCPYRGAVSSLLG